MFTTLAVKTVVKTKTKIGTIIKFEVSEVQTLSKENSKSQDAKNAVQIAPPQTHFFTSTIHRPTSLHPPFPGTPKVFQTPTYMKKGKGQNMRTTLLRPPTYDVKIQFHPSSVLPAFLLLISNFIQASPSLFLSTLRPHDIQTNTRAKIKLNFCLSLRRGCRDANLYNQIYFHSWQENSCDTRSSCRLYALTLTVTRNIACMCALPSASGQTAAKVNGET